MDKEELRIGNLVSDKNGELIDVKSIFGHYVNLIGAYDVGCIDFEYKLEELQPILLTEEWLLKFGFIFDKFQYSCYFTINEIKIKFNPYDLKNTFSFLFQGGRADLMKYKEIEIKEVHQLQNLYFALKQTELTLS